LELPEATIQVPLLVIFEAKGPARSDDVVDPEQRTTANPGQRANERPLLPFLGLPMVKANHNRGPRRLRGGLQGGSQVIGEGFGDWPNAKDSNVGTPRSTRVEEPPFSVVHWPGPDHVARAPLTQKAAFAQQLDGDLPLTFDQHLRVLHGELHAASRSKFRES
jgi:hypothetical protein